MSDYPPPPPPGGDVPPPPPPPPGGFSGGGAYGAGGGQYPPQGGGGYGGPAPTGQKTNGMAIASLVSSIVCLCGVGSILGIIFGVMAKKQIRESNGTQGGGGLATAGIIIGIVGILAVLAYVVLVVMLGVFGESVESDFQFDSDF